MAGPRVRKKKSTAKTKKKSAKKTSLAKPKKKQVAAKRSVKTRRVPSKSKKRKPAPQVQVNAGPPPSTPSHAAEPTPRRRGDPSERLLAACAELPVERSLTDEEREAMAKVSETAQLFLGSRDDGPPEIVRRIAAFVDEVRAGHRSAPKSQDVRLGLGVLWGEQLRAQVGWRWVHLTYPDGFASYALVPDDRAFACFPLNRVPDALRDAATNTSAHVFESIRTGVMPTRKANAYLVIG